MTLLDITLNHLPIFKHLTKQELNFLMPYLNETYAEAHDVLLTQGQAQGDLYIIISGRVNVDIRLPGDYLQQLASLSVGDIFGEVSFISKRQVTTNVTACEPTRLLVMKHTTLDMLRLANPHMTYAIEHYISYRCFNKIMYSLDNIVTLLEKTDQMIPSFSQTNQLENTQTQSVELTLDELDAYHYKTLNFLALLTPEQLTQLTPLLTIKRYDRGHRFIVDAQHPTRLGVIYSGAITSFIQQDNILIKPLDVTGIGDMFMQNAISDAFEQLITYVTCEQSIVIELAIGDYRQLRHTHPDLFFVISAAIHREIANSVYVFNSQFIRMNSEYNYIM
ncbi:MAG: hypothetical protein CMF38_01985 [Legionellaceae bacterium]|nr:hypothetical protein [Legionellaceae bacterium]HAF87429.1 hypothetical protein [Legionellales bacterium]HCA89198.1 hypothetical protein [Legionellales bacterium]|tara:strand:- start:1241 stop:2242 length:1002 start_codon:yes stop_codon:yes gene_type:complete